MKKPKTAGAKAPATFTPAARSGGRRVVDPAGKVIEEVPPTEPPAPRYVLARGEVWPGSDESTASTTESKEESPT